MNELNVCLRIYFDYNLKRRKIDCFHLKRCHTVIDVETLTNVTSVFFRWNSILTTGGRFFTILTLKRKKRTVIRGTTQDWIRFINLSQFVYCSIKGKKERRVELCEYKKCSFTLLHRQWILLGGLPRYFYHFPFKPYVKSYCVQLYRYFET